MPHERIKITVSSGHVRLEGDVEWDFQRKFTEDDVRRMTGVKSVSNAITVKPKASAVAVKSEIEKAFRRSAEIDARRVDVHIRDGKAILHGNVRSWIERDEAERAALAAPGVARVENELTVVP